MSNAVAPIPPSSSRSERRTMVMRAHRGRRRADASYCARKGCATTPRARRAGRSGGGASCKVRGKASRSRSASSESRRSSPGPCPRIGRRVVRAPLRLAAMQRPCRTGMRRMTGRGRHEGWIARHGGGGSEFPCVLPYRFRGLAGASDGARPVKELLTAPEPGTS